MDMDRIRTTPWWLYAVTFAALNVPRLLLFPPSRVGAAATVGLFVVVAAVTPVIVAGGRRILGQGRESR